METDLVIPTPALRLTRATLAPLALVLAAMTVSPLPADAASTVTIRITSGLSPATVTVAPGTRIVWVNRDDERHRVRTTESAPVKLDSDNLEPGESWSTTVDAVGTYAYVDERDRDDTAYHGRIIVRSGGSTGGGSAGGSTGGGSTGGGSTGGSGGTTPTRASVVIGDRTFQPALTTIAAGGSVTWLNGDDRAHTATGRTGGWDTGTLEPGQGAAERFPSPGTFAYLCAIHPEMQGTVRVVVSGGATPPPAPVAPKPTPRPTPTPQPETPAGGNPAPGALNARIIDFDYEPGSTTIAVGTTVTWTNDGIAPHTVTASDRSWDSAMILEGGSFSRVFDQPGTVAYLCSLHPQMTGRLVVEAGATPDPTDQPSQPAEAPVTPDPTDGAPSADPGGEAAVAPPPEPSTTPDLVATSIPVASAIDVGAAVRASLAVAVSLVALGWFARLIGRSTRA